MSSHEVVVSQEIVGPVFETVRRDGSGKPTVAVRYTEKVERPHIQFTDESGVKGTFTFQTENVLFED